MKLTLRASHSTWKKQTLNKLTVLYNIIFSIENEEDVTAEYRLRTSWLTLLSSEFFIFLFGLVF